MTDDAHRERAEKAFVFQGAMAVALTHMKRLAEKGYSLEGMPVMANETRCALIAADCDRLLAMLPADLIELAAKL